MRGPDLRSINRLHPAFYLLSLAFCLFPWTSIAADLSRVNVTSSVSVNEIKIGEQVEFKIVVEHDRGIDIFYPEETATLSPFEVVRHKAATRMSGFGRSATEITYSVTVFDDGAFIIPPVLITAKDGFGNERNIRTIEHPITVRTGTTVGNDIIDILPPMEVTDRLEYFKKALPYLPYLLPLLSAIAALIYLLSRRRQETVSEVDARTKALDSLNILKVDEENIVSLYFDISEILRTFFYEHLKLNASRMTSTEVLNSLKSLGGMERLLGNAEEFFFDLDLVKFSPFSASLDDARDAVLRAESLIKEVP